MRWDDQATTVKARLASAPWLKIALLVVMCAFVGVSVVETLRATGVGRSATAPNGTPLLSGEPMWGAWPSYLFGTNDTQNWDTQHNFETEPAIQRELKADHFPFIRTWFFQKSLMNGVAVSDAEQLTRMQADENAGLTCLGELPTENTMAYDEHIVTLMKGKCRFYEFMNEPDIEGVTAAAYVAAWTSEIPRLRAIDPQAQFGGPADYYYQGSDCSRSYLPPAKVCFMQKVMQGMANSGVLPDFITFHWYACYQDSAAHCMANDTTIIGYTATVRGWVQQYFHKPLPIGVTEWGADPSAPMPSYTTGAQWMTQFTTVALRAMQTAGLAFANQFDLANAGGYLTDDMVDIYHNGAPKPQYLAMKSLIAQARAGAATAPVSSAADGAAATLTTRSALDDRRFSA